MINNSPMYKSFNMKLIFTSLLLVLLLTSCSEEPRPEAFLSKVPLIPKPASVSESGSTFLIKNGLNIYHNEGDQTEMKLSNQIAQEWKDITGVDLNVMPMEDSNPEGIVLKFESENATSESYTCNIEEDRILLQGTDVGIYRAWQNVKQIILLQQDLPETRNYIPTGTIKDDPNFEYRGTMLDVSRHFFSVEDVKKHIDRIALYKFNYLHLHLSDDQGWRIEIKSWPNLTIHGGSTEVGGAEGGFYTQEDYKELVNYALDRFITIVPEIDMPGHTNAALASYPELNCDGKERELYTGMEVGFSTLCVKKELTYKFLDDVIGEIAAMTPGPYFHLGGDESHVTPKDEYLIFINRAVEIIKKHNKIPMGWDEFTAGDLEGESVAQHWHTAENAVRGQAKGGKVVMSPAKRAYLDMKYDSTSTYGLHWAALIDVKNGYDWDPDTYIPGLKKENILGIEAPLWSETISNLDEMEYLAFPRLLGYAELAWTPTKDRNWEDYSKRLAQHSGYLERMGIDFYRSPLIDWETTNKLDQ